MFDLIRESFAIYHLPVTVLLGVVLLFWCGVILGALDIDVFDFDHDMDVDMDVDADLDLDMDVDLDADMDVDADVHGSHSSFSILGALFKFINAHAVPTMVVLSFLALFMWVIALVANALFNPGEPFERNQLIALGLLVPNFIVSLLLTKIVTAPLKGFFKSLNYSGEIHVPVVGRTGIVKTSTLTPEFGQIEIVNDGAPIVVQARVSEGSLAKGTEVLITDHDKDRNLYTVRAL